MWLPQKFRRLPSEDPLDEQETGIILPSYPPPAADSKTDTKAYQGHDIRTDIEQDASPKRAEFTYNHPKSLVERLEEHEEQRLGTSFMKRVYETFVVGWRAGLLRALALSFLALVLNISIYAWLFSTYDPEHGTGTIYTGTCGYVKSANTGIHAGLNILSTMILGASTYAMQGLTAPTRREVDKAHARGTWIEIGAQSLRNLRYVRKRAMWYWALLGITSLPLHLFFNTVFFYTNQANQYAVAVVSNTFVSDTAFIVTPENSSPLIYKAIGDQNVPDDLLDSIFDIPNNDTVVNLLNDARNGLNIGDFVRMDPSQCIQNYTRGFLQDYADVVVVSSQGSNTSPILFTRFAQMTVSLTSDRNNENPYRWICRTSERPDGGDPDACTRERALQESSSGGNWTVYGNSVDHCLARVAPSSCQLQFNVWLMLIVLVCGAIKVIVILIVFCEKPSGRFLRTLGDAVASFIEDEDEKTKNMCLVSSAQIRKHGFMDAFPPQRYVNARPRWWTGANRTEYFTTVGTSAAYILILSTALFFAIDGAHGAAFNSGLGQADLQSLASFKRDDVTTTGIVPTLLIANIPQLGFSLLYVAFNTMFSKLLVAHEFDRLTMHKKGLRVSERPYGKQRSSHFFTLPARYALPLMAFSALIHWLTSQSLFMVRIDGVNHSGDVDPNDRLVRLGYSATGMIALISVTLTSMIATLCVGAFKRLHNSLGETSMSVIISAACHPRRYETDMHLQELQWGDVSSEPREGRDEGERIRHCAFTGRLARRPVDGRLYE